jgi:hypothetical protein
VYASLARAVLDPADAGLAASRIERLRRRHPRDSREALADRLIRRAGLQCAAAGALLSGSASFFGGLPWGLDLSYQVVTLNRLVLSLALLYRAEPSPGETIAGSVSAAAAGLASEALRQGVVRVLKRTLSDRPSARAAAGALAGAALGYGAARLLGELARETFSGRPFGRR